MSIPKASNSSLFNSMPTSSNKDNSQTNTLFKNIKVDSDIPAIRVKGIESKDTKTRSIYSCSITSASGKIPSVIKGTVLTAVSASNFKQVSTAALPCSSDFNTNTGKIVEDSDTLLTAEGQLCQAYHNSLAYLPGTILTNYGTFEVNSIGEWTYVAVNSRPEIQTLREGEITLDRYVIPVIDGSLENVTITIEGKNDKPIVTGDLVLDVYVPKNITFVTYNGQLNIEDIDKGEAKFAEFNQGRLGKYGILELKPNGSYTYLTHGYNEEIKNLRQGDTLVDTFQIQTFDNTAKDIRIVLHDDPRPLMDQSNKTAITNPFVNEPNTKSASLCRITNCERPMIDSFIQFATCAVAVVYAGSVCYDLCNNKKSNHGLITNIKNAFTQTNTRISNMLCPAQSTVRTLMASIVKDK